MVNDTSSNSLWAQVAVIAVHVIAFVDAVPPAFAAKTLGVLCAVFFLLPRSWFA